MSDSKAFILVLKIFFLMCSLCTVWCLGLEYKAALWIFAGVNIHVATVVGVSVTPKGFPYDPSQSMTPPASVTELAPVAMHWSYLSLNFI